MMSPSLSLWNSRNISAKKMDRRPVILKPFSYMLASLAAQKSPFEVVVSSTFLGFWKRIQQALAGNNVDHWIGSK